MPQPGRADQVYQLSLTELAFIVIFLILLLSGWMIVKTDGEKAEALREKQEAVSRLAELPAASRADPERLENLRQALIQAQQDLRRMLADRGMTDPEAIVSELVEKAQAETNRLRRHIDDLDAQLTALQEIRKIVQEAGDEAGAPGADGTARPESARQTILAAVELKRALEREAGERIAPGREQETARDYVAAWRAVRAGPGGLERLAKENRDLRAQAVWMRNQLEAHGGRDYPPCWVEAATGKPQYLLTVTLRDGGITIEPAWPPERREDAEKLPGVAGLAGGSVPLSVPAFKARLQDLDAESKAAGCRHYVRLINRVGSLATFNRQRYAVEEFFYKFEVR